MSTNSNRRNVVVVSIDSLRADYCISDASVPTKVLEGFASSGTVFENAIAPGPSTYESMPTIFTGVDPPTGGQVGGIAKQDRISSHLRSHRPLPAKFSAKGYTTIGVTPNPFTSRQFGFDTGFDHFDDFLDASTLSTRLRTKIVNRWMRGQFVGGLRFLSNMLGFGDVSIAGDEVVSRATQTTGKDEPFFLWLMLLDPHWPYQPPPPYRDGISHLSRYRANWRAGNLSGSTPNPRDVEVMKTLYRGTIRAVDDFLGVLRDGLDRYDPVYVIHADHGEAFGEHGAFGHGSRLYEENVHVPLVVGNVESATDVIQRPVSLRGLPKMVEHIARGGSDLERFTDDWVFARSERGDICARGETWKYYLTPNETGQFYDLTDDPGEKMGKSVALDQLPRGFTAHLDELARLSYSVRDQQLLNRM